MVIHAVMCLPAKQLSHEQKEILVSLCQETLGDPADLGRETVRASLHSYRSSSLSASNKESSSPAKKQMAQRIVDHLLHTHPSEPMISPVSQLNNTTWQHWISIGRST
jgi:hypothetical protein